MFKYVYVILYKHNLLIITNYIVIQYTCIHMHHTIYYYYTSYIYPIYIILYTIYPICIQCILHIYVYFIYSIYMYTMYTPYMYIHHIILKYPAYAPVHSFNSTRFSTGHVIISLFISIFLHTPDICIQNIYHIHTPRLIIYHSTCLYYYTYSNTIFRWS